MRQNTQKLFLWGEVQTATRSVMVVDYWGASVQVLFVVLWVRRCYATGMMVNVTNDNIQERKS